MLVTRKQGFQVTCDSLTSKFQIAFLHCPQADELMGWLRRSHNRGIFVFIEDMASKGITEIPYLLDINANGT